MTGKKLKTRAKAPTETRRLGYARASTYGQTINAQLAQLRAEGCTRIYREKMGGVRPDRRELLKLLFDLQGWLRILQRDDGVSAFHLRLGNRHRVRLQLVMQR